LSMRARRPVYILFSSLLLLSLVSVNGRPQEAGRSEQTESFPQSHLIRVSTNLVTVPVSVTDALGHPVRNLQIADFVVEEDGRPETLTGIADPGQTPLELALLVDVSGSVEPRFTFELQAAARFLRRVLRQEDTFAVFSIGPQPGLVQSRTANLEEGLRSVTTLVPTRDSTAFYDAVVMAAQFLGRNHTLGCRRIQVVISDGEDNNSESHRLADALQEVQRADCVFYSINPAGASIHLNKVSLEGQRGMDELARKTGGKTYVPDQVTDLDAFFDRITSEIRAQYLLEYYSSDQRKNGAYRQISVRLPSRPDLQIHARHGYYAATG